MSDLRDWRRRAAMAAALVGALLGSPGARAARETAGALRWQDDFQAPGGFGFASFLDVQGRRAFAAGTIVNEAGNPDFILRAYDLHRGEVLWSEEYDAAGGPDQALTTAASEDGVFIAGRSAAQPGNFDFVVRAHDPATAALLWEDRFDATGRRDAAFWIAADQGRVFAVGQATNAARNSDFLVRAYDAKTGALLWTDQVDGGGFDVANVVRVAGDRLLVGGNISTAGNAGFGVRVYEVSTGALLWEDRLDLGGHVGGAHGIAAQDGQVFVSGFAVDAAGNADFVVRAYALDTGAVLWQDRFDSGPDDEAFDVGVSAGRVVACGLATASDGSSDWIVRAYDAGTGAFVWGDRLDLGRADVAFDLDTRGSEVFVSGRGGTLARFGGAGGTDFLVRGYDIRDGSLLWQDRFDLAGGDDEAPTTLVAKGDVAVVGGDARNASGGIDFLVRAYELGPTDPDSADGASEPSRR